jgi:cytochrome P450
LDITKVGSHFTKDRSFYKFITFPGTLVGETNAGKHRIRRAVLTPAFSPTRVQELASMVEGNVDQLLRRFEEFEAEGKPVNIFAGMKAFTMDIISKIVFGRELGCIQDPVFKNQFIEYLHSTFDMGWTATAFPNLAQFSLSLPEWLSEVLFPIPLMEFKKVSNDFSASGSVSS